VRVEVRLERETVWLTQKQMAAFFDTSTDNVGLHLKKIFSEGELAAAAAAEDYSVVRIEGRRRVRRQVEHYNLDAIMSVGYRVNSRRGTQFRIWATRTLREHPLRGCTLNRRRLAERGLGEVEQAVVLLARTLTSHALVTGEWRAGLQVVQQYTRAWRLLLEYDEKRLAARPRQPVTPGAPLALDEARAAVAATCRCAAFRRPAAVHAQVRRVPEGRDAERFAPGRAWPASPWWALGRWLDRAVVCGSMCGALGGLQWRPISLWTTR
jgi:hypothetical protein